MAKKSHPPSPETSSPRRYLLVALGVVALLLVVMLVIWPRFRTKRWIADLHADNPVTAQAAREKLLESDDPGLNDVLAATLRDPGTSFRVRVAVGQVLMQRNRLALVEAALTDSDPAARQAALAILFGQVTKHGEAWFERSYVEPDPAGMRKTIEGWLAQERDASRSHAVRIAAALDMKDLVPAIRELLRPTAEVGATRQQHRLIEEAAKALIEFADCEGVLRFVPLAKEEPNDLVRLRMVQAVYRAVRGPHPVCPDVLSEAELKGIVLGALDGPANTRHGALLILRGETAWAGDVMDKLVAIVDEGTVGDFSRPAALGVLAETGDLEFANRLPRYFHDPDAYVRSEAVTASKMYAQRADAPLSYVDCWIGVLENETANEFAMYAAMGGLRDAAGKWLGLPPAIATSSATGGSAWVEFRKELFEQGEASGLSRQAWAKTWYRWWAAKLGLEGEAIDQAWAARQAFWTAARRTEIATRHGPPRTNSRPWGLRAWRATSTER